MRKATIGYVEQDRQCAYKCNVEASSHNKYCRRKASNVTYSECVFGALVIRHAKRTRLIMLLFVACPGLPCIFHIVSYTKLFFKIVIEYKMCVLVFSTSSFGIVSHFKNNAARLLEMDVGLHVKCPLFLSRCNQTWIFSCRF